MAKRISNPPNSSILMNSMRSIGYSFKTAIADIIDNSISANAKNIYIFSPTNDELLYVSILDDGFGMDKEELLNAMKYGSYRENYGVNDLGRFGLGLKSASSSQCKEFTVASKKGNQINAYKWDLNSLEDTSEWFCLELDNKEIEDLPNIDLLKKQKSGTLVIWENFDVAYKKNNGRVRDYIVDEMDEADKHIRLVFHRFLNRKNNQVNIYINNYKLEGYDPFLENHPKKDSKKPSPILIADSTIYVTQYILPHQTDLSDSDIEKLGGIESLRNKQGFYIYRNDRLIIYGTWFGLNSNNVNSELYKYGRIKVDIPNTLDDMWEVDIKKQSATIPKQILVYLKKSVINVCQSSKRKSVKRAKLDYETDDNRIWNKELSRNNKDYYYINKNSTYISNFINEFNDSDKQKIIRFIDSLSASLPYDDIYNSIANRKNETELNDETLDSIVIEGLAQIENIKRIIRCNNKTAYDKVVKYEPFNDEKISKLLWEKLQK